MNNLEDRIRQFEHMATADPDNDMAHFSLANAYLQAGRAAEAAEGFVRAIELNPEMSKAYELAGDAMIRAGWTDRAVETLEKGYVIAARKGDLMPRNQMGDLLKSIGREPPALSGDDAAKAKEIESSGTFVCSRTGRAGNKLEKPPFRGRVGAWIHEHIASETWNDWIGQGTKVINELRLDFSRDEDQATYDQHMYEYLGMEEGLVKELTS